METNEAFKSRFISFIKASVSADVQRVKSFLSMLESENEEMCIVKRKI